MASVSSVANISRQRLRRRAPEERLQRNEIPGIVDCAKIAGNRGSTLGSSCIFIFQVRLPRLLLSRYRLCMFFRDAIFEMLKAAVVFDASRIEHVLYANGNACKVLSIFHFLFLVRSSGFFQCLIAVTVIKALSFGLSCSTRFKHSATNSIGDTFSCRISLLTSVMHKYEFVIIIHVSIIYHYFELLKLRNLIIFKF